MAPQSVLIVGASRGLGQALVKHYAETIEPSKVFATTRGDAKDAKLPKGQLAVNSSPKRSEDSSLTRQ